MHDLSTHPDHVDVAMAMLREQQPLTKESLRVAIRTTRVDGIANARLNDTICDAQFLHRAGSEAAPRCKFTQDMFAYIHEEMAEYRREHRIAADQREADAVARVARERDEARADHTAVLAQVARLTTENASLAADLSKARADVTRLAAALAAAEKTGLASDDMLQALTKQIMRLERVQAPKVATGGRKRAARSKSEE